MLARKINKTYLVRETVPLLLSDLVYFFWLHVCMVVLGGLDWAVKPQAWGEFAGMNASEET